MLDSLLVLVFVAVVFAGDFCAADFVGAGSAFLTDFPPGGAALLAGSVFVASLVAALAPVACEWVAFLAGAPWASPAFCALGIGGGVSLEGKAGNRSTPVGERRSPA